MNIYNLDALPLATQISHDKLARIFFLFAHLASCCALFIAPFRASAGLRAGFLLLAALTVIAGYVRIHGLVNLKVSSRILVSAAFIWAGFIGIWVMLSPDWTDSLASWRGDVLTPLLAAWLFYVLTRSPADILRFCFVLMVGLLVLTTMVALDPFQPMNPEHSPLYGTVGLLSTWFITLAPLLPLITLAPSRFSLLAFVMAGIAFFALVVGALFTGNRLIWVCFAIMTLIGTVSIVLTSARKRAVQEKTSIAMLSIISAAVISICAAGFVASSFYRAEIYTSQGESPIEFMRKDNRGPIWRETLRMIGEKPFIGRGFQAANIGDTLSQRITEPSLNQGVQVRHGHNMLLNYALQLGIIGAGVLIFLFGVIAYAFLSLMNSPSKVTRLAATCGIALVLGVFLRNMFDDFFNRHNVLLFGALVGMLLGLATHQHQATLLHISSSRKLQPMQARIQTTAQQ